MEERLPVETRNTRCGSQDVTRVGACDVERRMSVVQELYGAKMGYAETSRKIEILTKSLSAGTRTGYRRSWERWLCFRRGQIQPARLDSRGEFRGESLVDFILCERDVLGINASTTRGGLSVYASSELSAGRDFAKVGERWGDPHQGAGYEKRVCEQNGASQHRVGRI